MNLLRFAAAWTGVATASIYVLAIFLWEGSWLETHHPWARYLPLATAALPWLAVTIIGGFRLLSRTLPSGGGDVFAPRWSDFRFKDEWDAAFYGGIALMACGSLAHRIFATSQFLAFAGFCLFAGGMSQRFWRVYEEQPDD